MAEVGPSFDTSGLALKSEVPTAATSAPPSVADSSAKGINLTILSLPSQPGATVVHAVALEP